MIFNSKHKHTHRHQDEQARPKTPLQKLAAVFHLPGHTHTHEQPNPNDALFKNELGIRTIKQALLLLFATTILQVAIFVVSNSVALLADTIHNLGDALNSIPLWLAFQLAKRAPTQRYTYGYGRAEDLAGLVIILSIVFSAGYIFFEAFTKLVNPQPIEFGGWVLLAALIGFAGNELVAQLQIRVGSQIGSEALIIDGRHARVDGLTSLAIVPAVLGSWFGLPILDPIFGLLIGIAILFITRDAMQAMWLRLMDGIDPHTLEHGYLAIKSVSEVETVRQLRMRWVGHNLHLVAEVVLKDSEAIDYHLNREKILNALRSEIPELADITLSLVSK